MDADYHSILVRLLRCLRMLPLNLSELFLGFQKHEIGVYCVNLNMASTRPLCWSRQYRIKVLCGVRHAYFRTICLVMTT